MRRSYLVAAAMTAVMVSACAQRMTREAGGDVTMDPGAASGAVWGSEIRGMNGWERIRGSGFAQLRNNGTRIAVTVERGFAGSNYGWDVREGTCATPGRVVGDPASYGTMFVGDDERDSKVADIDVRLEPGKPYIVNIYSQPLEKTTTIACGALKS